MLQLLGVVPVPPDLPPGLSRWTSLFDFRLYRPHDSIIRNIGSRLAKLVYFIFKSLLKIFNVNRFILNLLEALFYRLQQFLFDFSTLFCTDCSTGPTLVNKFCSILAKVLLYLIIAHGVCI